MILDDVTPTGGVHCETTTLGVLARHAGLDLSEPMLFGLGEGLGFVYWDAKSMDVPFLGGRTKPLCVTRAAAGRLGLELRVRETTSAARAWRDVTDALDAGHPVGLQLDSYHLDYFTTRVHFGGHTVAMYGYDETHAHLVDTAQQGGAVTTTLESLARARAARGPMTARHLSYTLTAPGGPPDLDAAVRAAVRANAGAFLDPPIANLGHRGIATAAARVTRWLDRAADPARDLPLAATLMERGGTGGALFRAVYRDFLAEAATVTGDARVRRAQRMYADIAPMWTAVADHIATAGRTGDAAHLTRASAVLTDLAVREREAMTVLAAVDAG